MRGICLSQMFQTPSNLPQILYLDDIWGIWTHSAKDFEGFVQTLNNHHPSIKLKPTLDPTEINFLDTTTFRTRKLDIKIYFKLTDSNALLH